MLWEGNRQIQEYTNDFVFTTVYDQDSFEPVSRLVQDRQDTSQIKVYHYHNNHLGTPQELTDECGEVVWCNYEFAWGGRYTHFYKEQFLNNCAILEHELQPIRFQGQFYDVETGLHYNRFRYYDSDVGMFISRDPIGLLGGINIFQYADNPVQFVDPLGLKSNSEELGENITGKKWVGNGRQAHHLIPVSVFNSSDMLKRLQSSKLFNLNGKGNGILLPEFPSPYTTRSKHKGGHSIYNQAIKDLIDDIDKNSKDDFERAKKVQSLQSKLHNALRTGKCGLYAPETTQSIIKAVT